MNNKINKVITLEDGKKLFVLKQAIYKGENYYMVAEVSKDGETLYDKFALLHEVNKDGSEFIETVKDPKTAEILLSHISFEGEE